MVHALFYNACRSVVVKLGGSVITRKDKPYTIDLGNIRRAAKALASAHARGARLAVVHGGGSFGHAKVSEILSAKGVLEPVDAPLVQLVMLDLARTVAKELIDAGVPAVLHAPHTYCSGPRDCDTGPILRSIGQGLVPVTFGDGVCVNGRVHIISGDDLAVMIARKLGDPCLIYVMSEEYVYNERGDPIRVLRGTVDGSIARETSGKDVTGGILKKLGSALEAAKAGVTTVITGIEGLEKLLLKGQPPESVGTIVVGE